jgi:hypothetical protein
MSTLLEGELREASRGQALCLGLEDQQQLGEVFVWLADKTQYFIDK